LPFGKWSRPSGLGSMILSRLSENLLLFHFITVFFSTRSEARMVQDKILCFVCAVRGIERTFNTYYELQDHLYRDHDMNKDPAMEIFNKYKSSTSKFDVA
jgi:hypothetical protein